MKKLDIKRALREHNMTQVELCKKTGLLTQNMSPIINGNPTISKLFQIAEGIGCDITDLFYLDPAEEAEEKESREKEMKQDIKKGLAHAKDDDIPLSQELQDWAKKAYPGIKKEEVEELTEKLIQGRYNDKILKRILQDANEAAERLYWGGDIPEGIIERDVNFVQQLPGSEPAYQVHSEGLVSENQQQMIQTSTFCPHCGKKVRVGVVLLNVEC